MTDEDALWAEYDAVNRQTTGIGVPKKQNTALLQQSSETVTRQRLQEDSERRKYAQSIGRLGDAICCQLHAAWRASGCTTSSPYDYVTGSGNPRDKCQGCEPKIFAMELYLIQENTPEEESLGLVDGFRRQKNSDEMYLREEALVDAELCGFIGASQRRSVADMTRRQQQKAANLRSRVDLCPYNCLIHVCVDEFCMLPPNATKKMRDYYNRVHQRPLLRTSYVVVGALSLESHVYFCGKHARFHICDEYCNQTQQGKHNERVCALSARVKRGAELEMGGDVVRESSTTTANVGESDYGGGRGVNHVDEDDAFANTDGDGQKSSSSNTRRPVYNEVSVIRDRGDQRVGRGDGSMVVIKKRGRGRGRGSIAGASAERSRLDRVRLAQSMGKSSGDDDATFLSPVAAAIEFERIAAGDIVRRSAGFYVDADGAVHNVQPARSTSKRRKLGRAKRVKSRLANQSSQMTLDVPSNFLEKSGDEEDDEEDDEEEEDEMMMVKKERTDDDVIIEPSVDINPPPLALPALDGVKKEHDVIMNSRLAVPASSEALVMETQKLTVMKKGKATTTTVSFDVRARVPFAERVTGKNDEEFAFDILTVQQTRKERLERFRLGGNAATNTFFSTSQLFEQYGERACAIIWQLLCSRERDAIEQEKAAACADKARSEIDTYCNSQRKDGRICSAEKMDQLYRSTHERAGLFKRLVVDDLLLKIVETYMALVVIEFYFNLVSMPRRLSMHLTQETADTIQTQFFFENFVPAILSLHCEGLVVNGITILPRDTFLLREYWPQPSTLRTMGVADQTMTHLVSTIRAYIEAARSSNVSMRRFEATVIDFDKLIELRAKYLDMEKISGKDRSRLAAREVVSVFISERARRLEALIQSHR